MTGDRSDKMILTSAEKENLKEEIRRKLSSQKEVKKIIVFGSFLESKTPHDIDVAIFQDSDESYLNLAMKYRKITREISKTIPLDIIPVRKDVSDSSFLQEIEEGELIYER